MLLIYLRQSLLTNRHNIKMELICFYSLQTTLHRKRVEVRPAVIFFAQVWMSSMRSLPRDVLHIGCATPAFSAKSGGKSRVGRGVMFREGSTRWMNQRNESWKLNCLQPVTWNPPFLLYPGAAINSSRRPRYHRFYPLDRKLCVPAFQQVCLFQKNYRKEIV
jgi:hypothetical protein